MAIGPPGWESRENRIVAAAFRRKSVRVWTLAASAATLAGAGATTPLPQQAGQQPPGEAPSTAHSLKLPQNPQVFGRAMPSVIKATAIVNGDVITQTDVEQRRALLAIANGGQVPADQADA